MCYSSASIAATILPGRPVAPRASLPRAGSRPAPWIVSPLAVAIHTRRDAASKSVGLLRRNEPFTVQVSTGGWRRVTTAAGLTGWVEAGQIRRDDRQRP
ncbi:SH3 domain-containing protein [Streptomyces sp. NPDC008122]|uniref:SH3 domain-containing protein n=1 Tax=Streptomyces sp. NPDC008122 TaxID=3364810 RepID=UPI0036E67D1D